MRTVQASDLVETSVVGVLSGLAGGLAEVGWIALYGAATGTPVNSVARGIVWSVIPALASSPWSPGLGVLIHLGLAIILGLAIALALRLGKHRAIVGRSESGLVMVALLGVWAVNFLVALPRINPAFVHILPYGVTLLSKLLFGFSAASVFRVSRMRQERITAG